MSAHTPIVATNVNGVVHITDYVITRMVDPVEVVQGYLYLLQMALGEIDRREEDGND